MPTTPHYIVMYGRDSITLVPLSDGSFESVADTLPDHLSTVSRIFTPGESANAEHPLIQTTQQRVNLNWLGVART